MFSIHSFIENASSNVASSNFNYISFSKIASLIDKYFTVGTISQQPFYLQVENHYWSVGNVINKDGSEVIIKNVDYPIDCCHVEGLLQNKNGIWYIVEYNAFSTDLWFEGIWDRRKAPKKIYGLQTLYLNYKE
jgi:hypothetical protein